jgi:hypothetical protein
MKKLFTMAIVLCCTSAFAQVPLTDLQIKGALLACPEPAKTGAKIYGYNDKSEFVVLREGTNEMVCIADDPQQQGFSAACYHKDLDPFMESGRNLKKQGRSQKEIMDLREAEAKSGKLKMPSHPSNMQIFYAPAENYNAQTGEVTKGNFRYVVYIPYATGETTGLPLKPEAPGMPWLMDPGTHRAHIMITPPAKE